MATRTKVALRHGIIFQAVRSVLGLVKVLQSRKKKAQ